MAEPAWFPLGEVTLSANAPEVVFSNIPNTYRDVVAISDTAPLRNGGGRIRLNGDSSTSYDWTYINGGTSGTPASYSGTTTGCPSFSFSDSLHNVVVHYFLDYFQTDYRKTIISYGGHTNGQIYTFTRWANATQITSITFSGQGGNIAPGSTFKIYGIKG